MAAPHILLVKRDKIGDLLLTTPLLAHLRQRLPQARIDVLCTDYNAWVIRDDRNVDRVIALPRVRVGRTLRIGKVPTNLALRGKLACMRYDAVLVAQGEESSRAVRRAFAVRARRVIAYAAAPQSYGRRLTDPVPPPPDTMHEIDRMLALARMLDLPPPDPGRYPRYLLPEAARSFALGWLAERRLAPGGYVVLGLGARRTTRQPSPAQVARWSRWWLERYGLATVFVWTPGANTNATYPGDDLAAESVVRMGLPHLHPYRGPIDETLGLVWQARTSVFPDSGLMHFAAASPGGVVGLFSGSGLGQPASRWAPRGARTAWVEAARDIPSEPDDAVLQKLVPLLGQ
jgi:ADP-heptose:LPS heptosyltransferase